LSQHAEELEMHDREIVSLIAIRARRSPAWAIERDMQNETALDACSALGYGIVTKIV
jgi:ATP-dependent protease ClpP protease subunit